MSQITSIFGSDDDDEILESLYMIANVSPRGATSFGCDPTKDTEHGGTWVDSRVDQYLRRARVHSIMVCMG